MKKNLALLYQFIKTSNYCNPTRQPLKLQCLQVMPYLPEMENKRIFFQEYSQKYAPLFQDIETKHPKDVMNLNEYKYLNKEIMEKCILFFKTVLAIGNTIKTGNHVLLETLSLKKELEEELIKICEAINFKSVINNDDYIIHVSTPEFTGFHSIICFSMDNIIEIRNRLLEFAQQIDQNVSFNLGSFMALLGAYNNEKAVHVAFVGQGKADNFGVYGKHNISSINIMYPKIIFDTRRGVFDKGGLRAVTNTDNLVTYVSANLDELEKLLPVGCNKGNISSNIFLMQAKNGTLFSIGTEICLDHEYGVLKKYFLEENAKIKPFQGAEYFLQEIISSSIFPNEQSQVSPMLHLSDTMASTLFVEQDAEQKANRHSCIKDIFLFLFKNDKLLSKEAEKYNVEENQESIWGKGFRISAHNIYEFPKLKIL